MAKKSNKKLIKKRLWELCKKIIKARDKSTCQWCGTKVSGSNCHTSHVRSKQLYPFLYFDLTNLKILCYHCHMNKWHKDPISATDWFNSKFPERVAVLDSMIQNSENRTKTIRESDYLELEEQLKEILERMI